MKISPARKSAFEILLKIEKENAFSSILLPIYEEKLSKKDKALCHELTLGVLRNKLYLDYLIKAFTKKNLKKFDLEVLTSLRLGIYQLKFLDKIPIYSVINESVNLVKIARKKSASGFVNAILRRASREKIKLNFDSDIEKISIQTSHPVWLIKKWSRQFSFEKAKEIALANNETPNLTFRFTNKFLEKDKIKQEKIKHELKVDENIIKSDEIADSFTAISFNDQVRKLAQKNLIYFQNEGSQLVGDVIDLQKQERFLDLCASPGSKTTFISSKQLRKGLNQTIFAGDLYRHRVKTLKENCNKQSAKNVCIIQYDAESFLPFENNTFDKVLIDSPCSGTGTIKHNPEIRYSLKEADFATLQSKQLKILNNASKLIKIGGKVIYSTCSLETEENEEVIKKFLEKNGGFEKIPPKLPNSIITQENFGKIFPNKNNTDGYFIAVLIRK